MVRRIASALASGWSDRMKSLAVDLERAMIDAAAAKDYEKAQRCISNSRLAFAQSDLWSARAARWGAANRARSAAAHRP